MTTTVLDARFIPNTESSPRGRLRRVASIARSEVKLLTRNRTVLLTAVAFGPAAAGAFGALNHDLAGNGGLTTHLVNLVFGFGAALAIYYNLTSILVAAARPGSSSGWPPARRPWARPWPEPRRRPHWSSSPRCCWPAWSPASWWVCRRSPIWCCR